MLVTDQTVDRDVVAFVRLGYEVGVSQHWSIGIPNRATFDTIFTGLTSSNASFDPALVVFTIGGIFEDASRVMFGRDGIPVVLTVEVPFWTAQRLGNTADTPPGWYTADERKAFTQKLIDWGYFTVHADEVLVEQYMQPGVFTVGVPGDNPRRAQIRWG